MNETFGERIFYYMRALKISQAELARRIGVHRSTVSRYLKDELVPDSKTIVKIADTLNVSPEYLLGGFSSKSDSDVDYGVVETLLIRNADKWSSEQRQYLKNFLD